MPRQRWATSAQEKWLESHLAGFIGAQRENKTAEWFPPLYTAWFDAFPLEQPTSQQIAKAGSQESATTKLREKRKGQIHWWLYNHTRGTTSGTGSNRVLKLDRAKRALQPYQAYLVLYGHRVLPAINEMWRDYSAGKREGDGSLTRLAFQTERAKLLLAMEPVDVVAKVEAFRKNPELEGAEEGDNEVGSVQHKKARKVASAVAAVPRTLQLAMKNLTQATGFVATILVGGPDPRTGQFVNYVYHEGRTTELGYSWAQVSSKWPEILREWEAFVLRCYGPTEAQDLAAAYANTELVGDHEVGDTEKHPEGGDGPGGDGVIDVDAVPDAVIDVDAAPGGGDAGVGVAEETPLVLVDDLVKETAAAKAVENEFEADRAANIARNEKLLADLGLAGAKLPGGVKPKPKPRMRKPKTKAVVEDEDDFVPEEDDGDVVAPRRSGRSRDAAADIAAASPSLPPTTSSTLTAIPAASTNAGDGPTPTVNTPQDVAARPLSHAAPTAVGPKPSANAPAVPTVHVGAPAATPAAPSSTTSPLGTVPAAPAAAPAVASVTAASVAPTPAPAAPVVASLAEPTAPITAPAAVSTPTRSQDAPVPSTPLAAAVSTPTRSQDATVPSTPLAAAVSTPTRSQDAPVPSTPVAAADSLTESVGQATTPAATATPGGELVAVTGTPPPHVTDMLSYFKSVSTTQDWQRLLQTWQAVEVCLGDMDSKKKENCLSSLNRPKEIAVWMKYGRKTDKMPSITNVAVYGEQWEAWWADVQPPWRGKGWPLLQSAGGDWSELWRGGRNGVFLAVLALSWWYAEAAELQDTASVRRAVADVTWAFTEMCKSNGSAKRAAPPVIESRPAKRARRR